MTNMKRRFAIAALAGSLLSAAAVAQLAEFGIEGMGVVSTRDTEVRASVGADGQRIVWGSTDRAGGAGGWDLWQARLQDKRWSDPQPLAINSAANDFDPLLSADGKWLYFFSNREGGQGGDDLHRAAVLADGSFGTPENLGPGVNGKGDEWAPTPSADGSLLLFASDGFGSVGGHDLFVARWNGKAFVDPQPVPGVNSRVDEFDAAWIDGYFSDRSFRYLMGCLDMMGSCRLACCLQTGAGRFCSGCCGGVIVKVICFRETGGVMLRLAPSDVSPACRLV